MNKTKGFTVIELLVALVLIVTAGSLFFIEKNQIMQTERDNQRKTAINAMYYSLEEVFYAQNKYYPSAIDSKVLRSMDPELFIDPIGEKIDSADSDYQYEATECSTDGKCKSYTLRAAMEREADYIKKSRNSIN